MNIHGVFSCDYGQGNMGKCLWFRVYGYGLHFKKPDGILLIKVKVLKPVVTSERELDHSN